MDGCFSGCSKVNFPGSTYIDIFYIVCILKFCNLLVALPPLGGRLRVMLTCLASCCGCSQSTVRACIRTATQNFQQENVFKNDKPALEGEYPSPTLTTHHLPYPLDTPLLWGENVCAWLFQVVVSLTASEIWISLHYRQWIVMNDFWWIFNNWYYC